MIDNRTLIQNGIYTTEERIILIEKITDKSITILNLPRIIMDSNQDVRFVVKNLDYKSRKHYREHHSNQTFFQIFGDQIDGYLGEFK